MYDVIIADDEEIERDALKIILEQSRKDIRVSAIAENGIDFLQLVRKKRFDIALVDIQMPGLSGLEAIQMAASELEDTAIIIITAYDDFKYAQISVKCHVFDYLLKPVSSDKLCFCVTKCIENLETTRRNKLSTEKLNQIIEQIRPSIEDQLISGMINGIFNASNFDAFYDSIRIKPIASYVMVICVVEKTSQIKEIPSDELIKFYERRNELLNEIISTIRAVVRGAISQRMGSNIISIIPIENRVTEYQQRLESINLANIIRQKVITSNHERMIFGIGTTKIKYQDLNSSYKEAFNAANDQNVGISIRHYNDLFGSSQIDYEEKVGIVTDAFMEIIQSGVLTDLDKIIHDNKIALHGKKFSEISDFYLEAFIKVLERLKPYLGMYPSFSKEINLLYKEQVSITNEAQLENWVSNTVKSLSTEYRENLHSGQVIDRAKQFIETNFSKNISQTDVAQFCNVSIYYLSRLFKEKLNKNYSVYLNQIRIEAAEKMIQANNYSLKTIAEVCVFNSV